MDLTSARPVCMLMCMRTNIVLNDELVREAMRHSQARTKRGLVEEALRTLIRVKEEERRRAAYAERLDALRPRLARVRLREAPARVLRHARESL